MKDDAVIKDNEAVYLLNEQTYLHLRQNLQGVGYEVFDKNSPLPVEEGQIPREALGNTQRRIETARAYYLAEHQDEPVGRIQNQNFFIIEINGVHKRIDKRFPVAFYVRVEFAEPGQPEPNLIFA